MSPRPSATARAYRVLLIAYPRSLRRAMGSDMAQLVDDRRRLDGEPLWRLWPSLLSDTARGVVVTRWEELMSTKRAIVLGLLGTVAVLAVLSGGPRTALPVVVAVATAATAVVRSRRPTAAMAGPTRSWRRWLVVGIALVAATVGYVQLDGDPELTGLEWVLMLVGLMGGLFAALTGLVLRAADRGRSIAT